MATYYVRSGAVGTGSGADWANAFVTMALALVAKAAGDVFYVSEDHAESTAALTTLTFPGTIGNPNFVYCVDHLGTVPPVSADLRTTATVTTTGAASTLTLAGSVYIYGIIFSAGNGANAVSMAVGNTNIGWLRAENCAFRTGGTTGGAVAVGRSNSIVWWKNCTVQFASVSSVLTNGGVFYWDGGSITGATFPTLFFGTGVAGVLGVVTGVDLSALSTGKTILQGSNTSNQWVLMDCQFDAAVTISGTPTNPALSLDVLRSASGATPYLNQRNRYQGTLTTEISIVRQGGTVDAGTPVSWQIDTTANSRWTLPFTVFPTTPWNSRIGAPVTVTVYGTINAGAVPNNDDIWIDVEYLGSASETLGSFVTTTKADGLAAGTAVDSDGSTWGGGGSGAGWSPFKLEATLTSPDPAQVGQINVWVRVAKASTTYYVDPQPVLS